MVIKPLAAETTLTAATSVGSATVVRLVNTGTTALVTIKDGATTVSSLTILQNESIIVEKEPTYTLEGGAAIKAVKVAFTN